MQEQVTKQLPTIEEINQSIVAAVAESRHIDTGEPTRKLLHCMAFVIQLNLINPRVTNYYELRTAARALGINPEHIQQPLEA